MFKSFLLFIGLGIFCGSLSASWQSPYYVGHPLVGKIFAVEQSKWVTEQELDLAMASVQYLLLGETHNNADHHVGQARLIEQWLAWDADIGLVFEMIEVENWPAFGQAWSHAGVLSKQLKTIAPRWPWDLYEPVLSTAINHALPLYAANINRSRLSQYAKNDVCYLAHEHKEIEFCDTIAPSNYQQIKDLVFAAHCGYLPANQLDALANIQIAKDASFALRLAQVSEPRAVLIAGAVHVRKDIGVPQHLQRMGLTSLSVAFLSVDPARLKPEEYIDSDLDAQYDFIYFTPSHTNEDPCVKFAEQLKRMKLKK